VSPTETSSSTRREIQVEIPVEEVNRETDSLIQKYQKLARIPGFRRGHVPASVIRQRFSEDLKSDVVEALVPRYFRKETDKQGLVPVSQPQVTDLQLKENEPLREQHATYTSVEGRALADGDYAQVSLDGQPKDGDGKPVHMDEIMVEIAGKDTMPEFSENLRGASAGDERVFDVVYAQDAAEQRLAGKTFTYTLKVQSIKHKSLPEVDDQFATQLGEFKNLDEVRQRIREGMQVERKHAAEHAAKDKLVAELVKRSEFEVPEALVERQIDVRLERGLRALAAQGMKAEDIKKMDLNRLRVGQREQALQEVKASLLLDKIAEEETIEVSDEEINGEIVALATQSKQTPEAIRARLTRDGALDRIRNRIRSEKTLDFLYRQSA